MRSSIACGALYQQLALDSESLETVGPKPTGRDAGLDDQLGGARRFRSAGLAGYPRATDATDVT